MTNETLAQIRAWFEGYVAGFKAGDRLPPMQVLKLEHSLRVMDIVTQLTADAGMHPELAVAARAAGLLHDVGRFSQYAEFGTFVDRLSVNHAQRGAEILMRGSFWCAGNGWQRTVTDAVRVHNVRELPPGLPSASRMVAELVRDADKLDIMEILDDAVRNGKLGDYPEIALHVDLEGPPSSQLLACLAAGGPLGYESIRSLADFLLILVNWVFELNTAAARRLARERDVVFRLGAHLPELPAIRAHLDSARRHLSAE